MGSADYEKQAGGEATERRGSRKASVMDAIKNNYGINDEDDFSIKKGDSTHRMLKPRHIQLIGIGGTIGTALFVQIGRSLINGGPGSLFLAFTIWSVYHVRRLRHTTLTGCRCFVILCVTNCKISKLISHSVP